MSKGRELDACSPLFLATIYGLMLGLVRRRSGGMLAPWSAHVGTDVALGSILLTTIW